MQQKSTDATQSTASQVTGSASATQGSTAETQGAGFFGAGPGSRRSGSSILRCVWRALCCGPWSLRCGTGAPRCVGGSLCCGRGSLRCGGASCDARRGSCVAGTPAGRRGCAARPPSTTSRNLVHGTRRSGSASFEPGSPGSWGGTACRRSEIRLPGLRTAGSRGRARF